MSFLAALALSCSAQAPPSAAAAPEPSARPVASSAAPASSSSEPSDAGAPAPKSRRQEMLEAADRLMGGELTRAEEKCAAEPVEKREACVDAHLAAHDKKLEDEAMRSVRALELLQKFGNGHCTAAPAEKKDECSARAINALLKKMGDGCPPADSAEGHRCIVEKVLAHLGP